MVYLKFIYIFCCYRGSEHAIPKNASLASPLFWVKGLWKIADYKGFLLPFYLKVDHKFSHGKDGLSALGREEHYFQ